MGRGELLNRPAVAIVGSRQATPQGLDDARAFARALADRGPHRGVGTGAGHRRRGARGRARRRRHRRSPSSAPGSTASIRRPIASSRTRSPSAGSSSPSSSPGTTAAKWHFPRRNRLISRARARRARRRGEPVLGLADHRAARRRAGPRSDGDAGLDPLAVVEGLPQADPRRRQAGRDGAGRAGRARPRRTGGASPRPQPRVADPVHAPLLAAHGRGARRHRPRWSRAPGWPSRRSPRN